MRHRVTTDPREHFVRTEEERRAENDRYVFERNKLTSQFEAELAAEYRKAGIRSPGSGLLSSHVRTKHPELYAIVIEPYERRAKELQTQHNEQHDTLTKRLHTLATWASIRTVHNADPTVLGPPWIEFYTSHESAWHTQTAPRAYAEASVNARLWTVGYAEPRVPCVIMWDGPECKLYVAVEEDLDRRILYTRCYHEGVPVGEFMRRCWARAWNPRVLDPFLPAGLEDKLGLDYQGRDKHATAYQCARCKRLYEADQSSVFKHCECGFDLRPIHGDQEP